MTALAAASSAEPLGILRLEALTYYVHDLPRVRAFLTGKLDFAEIGKADAPLELRGKQTASVFQAGKAVIVVCAPQGQGGRAWRYLRKHPEGVGTLTFAVQSIDHTFRLIEARGGTIINDIERFQDEHGTLAMFSITTPFGDTTFRFLERRGYKPLFPGFVMHPGPQADHNRFGFGAIDHVTSNFQTMSPALLWMKHVMGWEPFWDVKFHTEDVAHHGTHGSGLKSVVMWDPDSGLKFACNEPLRPFFKHSQINVFSEDHRGDGVQHAALSVPNIIETVKGLRDNGVEFMPTPGSYFDMLPARLQSLGVRLEEDLSILRALEILVDGEGPQQYLLQIFLKEAASLLHDPEAGPFFFEIIQRKGSRGFGAGNFRALFESIEREQRLARRIS